LLALAGLPVGTALAGPPPAPAIEPGGSVAGGAPADPLASFDAQVQQVVRQVSPATVGVSGGSGVIVSSDGLVFCVAHVGRSAGRRLRVTLGDGRRATARVVGTHEGIDAAVLQLAGEGPWPFVPIELEAPAAPGDWLLTLGYPVSYQHGQPPAVRIGRCLRRAANALVSDCPIMGGDSGGPVFDLQGRLVAISSRCRDDVRTNLHVPVQLYHQHWQRLVSGRDWDFGARHRSLPRRPEWDDAARAASWESAAAFPQGTAPDRVVVRKPSVAAPGEVDRVGLRDALPQRGAQTQPGREAPAVLALLEPAVAAARASSAELLMQGAKVGLATVLAGQERLPEQGLGGPPRFVVSKASRLPDALRGSPVTVRLNATAADKGSGRELAADWLGIDRELDLVVYRIREAVDLPAEASRPPSITEGRGAVTQQAGPFHWATQTLEEALQPGAWLVTTTGGGNARVGFVSAGPRSFPLRQPDLRRDRPMLGVSVAPDAGGARVTQVVPGSGASEGGLQTGDVIRELDGAVVQSADELVSIVGRRAVGEVLSLVWQREGETQRAEVTLGAFQRQATQPGRYDRWGGGPFSARRFDIPAVLSHDIPLAPEDCGGPLCDRHGRLVGINIARALRVATYAVPIERVWQAIADLQAI